MIFCLVSFTLGHKTKHFRSFSLIRIHNFPHRTFRAIVRSDCIRLSSPIASIPKSATVENMEPGTESKKLPFGKCNHRSFSKRIWIQIVSLITSQICQSLVGIFSLDLASSEILRWYLWLYHCNLE
jgi:hypothetical protein